MANDFDSQPDVTQGNTLSPAEAGPGAVLDMPPDSGSPGDAPPESSASPLRLVASTVLSEPIHKSPPSPKHYFTAETRKRSPDDFIMVARDAFHYLHCELPLKFEASEDNLSLICQFPTICDDALVDFIEDDEDLLGMVLISFHLQILKNLFILCESYQAQKLILQVAEDQFEGLEIYQEFIKYVDKTPLKKGIDREVTIPFQSNSLKQCYELIDTVTLRFREILWEEQRTNPAIRAYLKSNVRLSIVD